MQLFYYVRGHLFVLVYHIFVLVDLICSDNTGDVLYKNVSTFRGTMCQVNHTAFNVTETSSNVNCAIKCVWHQGCHSFFYDRDTKLCVGCAQRYNTATDAAASELDYLHFRGICGVSLVSGPYGIPDDKITVSSHYVEAVDPELHGPKYSRLNTVWTVPGSGAWSSNTVNPDEYIQAEFYNVKLLTAIASQGRADNEFSHQYVTEYEVHYSLDCSTFSEVVTAINVTQVFRANFDRDTVVTNNLTEPVYARCVRIYPTGHNNWKSMRFDLIGCI